MKNHKKLSAISFQLSAFALLVYAPVASAAATTELTLRYQHHIFTLRAAQVNSWRTLREEWRYDGHAFRAPQELRTESDEQRDLPAGVLRTRMEGWDREAIATTLRTNVAAILDRPAGQVVIHRAADGVVTFDGIGLPGRILDIPASAVLIVAALDAGVTDITLPVRETQPIMDIVDPALQALGITEVVTVGESEFAKSPAPRRHNIAVGLKRFNGHIIPRGETFSFNAVLGPVNAATGYKKELVILGERTLPDYGGGLCQVSTTAYRGAWEYGLPITDRRNHSFAVRYYGPQGTDATVYPPNTDLQFTNDTPGALLLQTHVDGDKAYFIYYGTRDGRSSDVYGPYTWDPKSPPADRSEYTADIPPGTTRKVGDAVPGMRAAWFRVHDVVTASGTTLESIDSVYSIYEARPLFTQIGVPVGSPLLGNIPADGGTSSVASSRSRSSAARSSLRPARRRN